MELGQRSMFQDIMTDDLNSKDLLECYCGYLQEHLIIQAHTVISEIFVRILFSSTAFKGIFVTLGIHDLGYISQRESDFAIS